MMQAAVATLSVMLVGAVAAVIVLAVTRPKKHHASGAPPATGLSGPYNMTSKSDPTVVNKLILTPLASDAAAKSVPSTFARVGAFTVMTFTEDGSTAFFIGKDIMGDSTEPTPPGTPGVVVIYSVGGGGYCMYLVGFGWIKEGGVSTSKASDASVVSFKAVSL